MGWDGLDFEGEAVCCFCWFVGLLLYAVTPVGGDGSWFIGPRFGSCCLLATASAVVEKPRCLALSLS